MVILYRLSVLPQHLLCKVGRHGHESDNSITVKYSMCLTVEMDIAPVPLTSWNGNSMSEERSDVNVRMF